MMMGIIEINKITMIIIMAGEIIITIIMPEIIIILNININTIIKVIKI